MVPMRRLGTLEEFAVVLHAVPRRHEPLHDGAVRRLRRGAGRDRATPVAALLVDSLARRMRAMHSLYYQAVDSMDLDHVNHFERDGVLPIAFSLFHYTNMQDASFMAAHRRSADLGRRSGRTRVADDGQRPRQGAHRRRDDEPADRRLRGVQGVPARRLRPDRGLPRHHRPRRAAPRRHRRARSPTSSPRRSARGARGPRA